MSVSLEHAPTIDLGDPPQTLHLDEFGDALELLDVLLDASVGELRQRLGAERIHRRSQIAHARAPRCERPCIEGMRAA
jgi:hypothetical protein